MGNMGKDGKDGTHEPAYQNGRYRCLRRRIPLHTAVPNKIGIDF